MAAVKIPELAHRLQLASTALSLSPAEILMRMQAVLADDASRTAASFPVEARRAADVRAWWLRDVLDGWPRVLNSRWGKAEGDLRWWALAETLQPALGPEGPESFARWVDALREWKTPVHVTTTSNWQEAAVSAVLWKHFLDLAKGAENVRHTRKVGGLLDAVLRTLKESHDLGIWRASVMSLVAVPPAVAHDRFFDSRMPPRTRLAEEVGLLAHAVRLARKELEDLGVEDNESRDLSSLLATVAEDLPRLDDRQADELASRSRA